MGINHSLVFLLMLATNAKTTAAELELWIRGFYCHFISFHKMPRSFSFIFFIDYTLPSTWPLVVDAYFHSFIVNYSPFRMVSFKAYIALQLFYKSSSPPTLPLSSPPSGQAVLGKYWAALQGRGQNGCAVPFIHFLITTLSQHSDALSWNVLVLSDDACSGFSLLSFFSLFILETQVKLERQMFLFARPCRMTCSFRRLLPVLPPYRVTAGLADHCGRLRKRRGKSKRRLRIKWRRIPEGSEEAGESHLLSQFQMTLLGSVTPGRKCGWLEKNIVGVFISTCRNADVSKGQILYSL